MRAAVLLGVILVLAPGVAHASCSADETPTVGVRLRRCATSELRWVELVADLAAVDLGTRASKPDERGLTAPQWASRIEGVAVALPGGPFAFPRFVPLGLTVGDGVQWTEAADDGQLAVLAFDGRAAALIAPTEQAVPYEPWMRDVVSGVEVLRDGASRACVGDGCDRAPRAAIGLSEDGRMLIAVAVEGWTDRSRGATDAELGELARAAGGHDAIRTADGAASAVWVRDRPGLLIASDGDYRAAAAFLGIVDRSRGATGQIVGVVQQTGDAAPLPNARLRIETTDGALVGEGGTLNSNAYFSFELPAREYVIRARLDGYRTACRICPVRAGYEEWCTLFLARGSGSETCTPSPRGIDAGPWPIAPSAPDAGANDAGSEAPSDGGCAIGRSNRGAWWGASAIAIGLALLRRRSTCAPCYRAEARRGRR